jgi:hypothetical protein
MNLVRKKVVIISAISTFIVLCIMFLVVLISKWGPSSENSNFFDDGSNNDNRNDSKVSETPEIPKVCEDLKKSNNLVNNKTSEISEGLNISEASGIPKVTEDLKKSNNLDNNDNSDTSEISNLSKNSEIPKTFGVLEDFTLVPVSPNEYQISVQEKIQKVKAAPSSDKFTVLLNILESSFPFFPVALRVLLREMLLDKSLDKPQFFKLNYLTLFYSNDLKMLLKLSKVPQSELENFSNGILKRFDSFLKVVFDTHEAPAFNKVAIVGVKSKSNEALFEVCEEFHKNEPQDRIRFITGDLKFDVIKCHREYAEYKQNPLLWRKYSLWRE